MSNYADVAKAIYDIGREENWTQEQIFKYLNDPSSFIKWSQDVSSPSSN